MCHAHYSLPVALTEATDKYVCDLANGFYEELCKLHVEKNVESAVFFRSFPAYTAQGIRTGSRTYMKNMVCRPPFPSRTSSLQDARNHTKF